MNLMLTKIWKDSSKITGSQGRVEVSQPSSMSWPEANQSAVPVVDTTSQTSLETTPLHSC
ncbi:hypothetical protein PM082_023396 [Marasmius tenuissimus]|nr:hypothetical protein PM082_023396 [Marasmius tenuissimus]